MRSSNLTMKTTIPAKTTPTLRFPGFSDMWEEKKLGDIVDVKGGKRIPLGYSLQTTKNTHPYITVSDMDNGSVSLEKIKYVPNNIFEKIKNYKIGLNDIYVSVAGTLGLVGIVPPELDNANLTENANKLTNLKCNQLFLLSFLNAGHLEKLVEAVKTSNAQPKLAIYALKSLKINLPSPEEQNKIAEFLSGVDEWIDNLKKQKENLESYKKGMMQKIFSQEIRFKDEEGKDFAGWEEKRLGDITEVIVGGTPSTSNNKYWGGNIGWLASGDLNDGLIIKPSKYITEVGLKNSSTKLMPKNTVLLAMTGATLGRIGFLNFPSAGNQSIAGFIPKDSFDSWYLFYSLTIIQNSIFNASAGAAQPGINKSSIENLEVPFPGVKEQKKIANFLNIIDKEIENKNNKVLSVEKWKQGLMQNLFV